MVGARVQRVMSLGMLVCLFGGATTLVSAQGRRVGGPPAGNGPRITTTNAPDHPSPPQPQQRQGLDYFRGAWTFAWTGRENPISLGPRSGTAVFTPSSDGRLLTQKTTGTTDDVRTRRTQDAAERDAARGDRALRQLTGQPLQSRCVGRGALGRPDVGGDDDWRAHHRERRERAPWEYGQTMSASRGRTRGRPA